MPAITWFIIPADDADRAGEYYRNIFDWKVEPFPGRKQEGVWMVSTDEKGMGGEIFPRTYPGEPIVLFVSVPSIEEFAQRAVRFGGELVVQKTAVPGRGYFVICQDTEQNRFGLWEDDPSAL
jgi:predicted enzyme related to lactoylglutathione lyase